MKVVTVNIPESYIESIKKLVGDEGLYPSRSELIRVAVRDFLIRELKRIDELVKFQDIRKIKMANDPNFVHVPIDKINENGEPIREFKTFRIVKRLEN